MGKRRHVPVLNAQLVCSIFGESGD